MQNSYIFNSQCNRTPAAVVYSSHLCVSQQQQLQPFEEGLLPGKFFRSVGILNFCKISFILNAKKVEQTSLYVSSIACSVYDSKFKFIGNLKHLSIQCYNFILVIPSQFCEISKTALWVLRCVYCGFCHAMGCSAKTKFVNL